MAAIPTYGNTLADIGDSTSGAGRLAMTTAERAKLGVLDALNPGANITDASATIQPTTDHASEYTLPAATLSTNRTTTVGVTGPPVTGKALRLVRRDLSANTWTIANGGTNGGNIFVFGGSAATPTAIWIYYNGADWILNGALVLQS